MSEIYTGNNITIENFGYNKANINIKGKTEQEIIQEVKGKTLTGESISANDIEKEKGKIEIKGNAEQDGEPTPDAPIEIITVGQNVNIIPTDPSEWEQGTINEGVVEASTTRIRTKNYCLIDVLEHTISMISGQNYVYGNIHYYNSNKTYINNQYILSGDKDKNFTKLTFTPPEGATYFKVVIKKSDDSTILASEISDVKPKLEKGSKAMPYSPYGQGSVEIDVCNKNIIDLTVKDLSETYGSSCKSQNVNVNSIELIPVGAWSNFTYHFDNLKKNTDYTINANFLESVASSSNVGITVYQNSTDSFSGLTSLGSNVTSVSKNVKEQKKVTFNTGNYEHIFIRFWANSSATSIVEGNSLVFITEIQLEMGSTETNYVEHESKKIILPIQKEFVKIGDVEDTFVKVDGKWYEAHYHPKYTMTGNETILNSTTLTDVTRYIIQVNNIVNAQGLCNYYKYLNSYTSNTEHFYLATNQVVLFDKENSSITFKNRLKSLYDNNTPVIVYPTLKEPELIECTEEQQKVLLQLYDFPLYLPTTNLSVKSSTAPNVMLIYNYVIPSPSIEKPSKILTVGQNVQLFDKNNANKINAIINEGTKQISAFDTCRSVYIPCNKNEEYTISRIVGTRFIVGTTTDIPASGSVCNQVIPNNAASSITIKTGENDNYLLVFYYNTGTDTLTEQAIIDSLKISKGTSTGAYSSYGQGGVEIDVVNKNILNLKEYFKGEIAYGSSCEGHNFESNYIELIPKGTWSNVDVYISGLKLNTDYTISANFLETIATSAIVGFTVMGNTIRSTQNSTGLGNNNSAIKKNTKTFKPFTFNTSNYTYIIIRFYANWSATNVAEGNSLVKVSEIQLEIGSTATDYVPHESKKIILPIQKEFVKIGDVEDTFIKKDGEWYEAHYSPKFVFDGTETWYYHAENHRFYTNMPKSNKSQLTAAISTHFKYGNTEKDNEVFNVGDSQIFFRDESITSSTNWKAWLAEEYSKGTPLETYYVRETPELIECTPAQENVLNQLENIHLYEGVNNIISTSSINPDLEIIITKAIEDYMCYISTAGKFVIPDSKIEYLIDFNESNIPTMPEATESAVKAAGRDGDIVLATTYEPIPLNIVCYTEDNLTLLEKVEEEKKVNKFLNSIKNRTIDLAIEKDNKYYNVKYSGALTTINFPKHLKFAIPLKSSASYGKDLIQKSIVGSGKGESETIEATGATFVIRGPAIKPIISFNDYSMEYNIDILEGARVEIDSNKSTATHVNSDGIRTNVMKHYNHQFPKIENGINELKILSGLDDDMNVSVVWNDLKL